jgi:hypothetical protein
MRTERATWLILVGLICTARPTSSTRCREVALRSIEGLRFDGSTQGTVYALGAGNELLVS